MTLHYPFPIINHVSDLLSIVKGRDDFVVAEKPEQGLTIINYVQMRSDTFPPVVDDAENRGGLRHIFYHVPRMLRECRGLVFDFKTGKLLSRRYHKFRNLSESADDIADFSKPHLILEKLDGSMVSPVQLSSGIRWITKMGITPVAMQAEVFVAEQRAKGLVDYTSFAELCIAQGETPIFEWCSRKSQIVVDYEEDALVLTAIRRNATGEYAPYDWMRAKAMLFGVPVVKAFYRREDQTLEDFFADVRAQDSSAGEGVVVRFDDGHMVKIKSDRYVTLHRAKDKISNERAVLKLVMEEAEDDLLPLLPEADRERLRVYADRVRRDVNEKVANVVRLLRLNEHQGYSRKTFAIISETWSPPLRAACFAAFEQLTDVTRANVARDFLTNFILKSTSTNKAMKERLFDSKLLSEETRWSDNLILQEA